MIVGNNIADMLNEIASNFGFGREQIYIMRAVKNAKVMGFSNSWMLDVVGSLFCLNQPRCPGWDRAQLRMKKI